MQHAGHMLKLSAAFSASSHISGEMVCGVCQLNKACVATATRRMCPLDFNNIPTVYILCKVLVYENVNS